MPSALRRPELRAASFARAYDASMSDDGWVTMLPLAELPEGRLTHVDLGDRPVLLYRHQGRVFAIAGRCTHAGSPLDRGPVQVAGSEATITCPAHGSRFRLEDGRVVRPPARDPLPVYAVRTMDDSVQLRRN
jgi:nitrite reductase/ring-hydroxylating ferredoxin subunit